MTDEDENLISDEQPPSDVQVEDNNDGVDEEKTPGKKSAEARINEILAKNKQLEEKLATIEEKMAPPPPAPIDGTQALTPSVQKAVDYLKDLGFVTKDQQDKKMREIQDRATLDSEHVQLESRFSGSDGRPKYERKDVEDYMQKRGIYNAEAAYKLMFEKELFDAQLKDYEGDRRKKPFVQKAGSSAGTREDNTITREKIADWLKSPEGRVKYEQNREKILKMMANSEL